MGSRMPLMMNPRMPFLYLFIEITVLCISYMDRVDKQVLTSEGPAGWVGERQKHITQSWSYGNLDLEVMSQEDFSEG